MASCTLTAAYIKMVSCTQTADSIQMASCSHAADNRQMDGCTQTADYNGRNSRRQKAHFVNLEESFDEISRSVKLYLGRSSEKYSVVFFWVVDRHRFDAYLDLTFHFVCCRSRSGYGAYPNFNHVEKSGIFLLLFTAGPGCRSEYSKLMPIRPDPDPQNLVFGQKRLIT